jgi:hypothetical protein
MRIGRHDLCDCSWARRARDDRGGAGGASQARCARAPRTPALSRVGARGSGVAPRWNVRCTGAAVARQRSRGPGRDRHTGARRDRGDVRGSRQQASSAAPAVGARRDGHGLYGDCQGAGRQSAHGTRLSDTRCCHRPADACSPASARTAGDGGGRRRPARSGDRPARRRPSQRRVERGPAGVPPRRGGAGQDRLPGPGPRCDPGRDRLGPCDPVPGGRARGSPRFSVWRPIGGGRHGAGDRSAGARSGPAETRVLAGSYQSTTQRN